MNQPNKNFIKAWVQALRSGKYQQGQSKLHRKTPDGDEFCCLGVACDLALTYPGAPQLNVQERTIARRSIVQYNGEGTVLPSALSSWIFGELTRMNSERDLAYANVGAYPPDRGVGYYTHPDHPAGECSVNDTQALTDLNDGGWTFSQIADAIESVWLKDEQC